MNGLKNPSGSKRELTVERIPRLVAGLLVGISLNWKVSEFASQWSLSALPVGRTSRSRFNSEFARSFSGSVARNLRLLLAMVTSPSSFAESSVVLARLHVPRLERTLKHRLRKSFCILFELLLGQIAPHCLLRFDALPCLRSKVTTWRQKWGRASVTRQDGRLNFHSTKGISVHRRPWREPWPDGICLLSRQ